MSVDLGRWFALAADVPTAPAQPNDAADLAANWSRLTNAQRVALARRLAGRES